MGWEKQLGEAPWWRGEPAPPGLPQSPPAPSTAPPPCPAPPPPPPPPPAPGLAYDSQAGRWACPGRGQEDEEGKGEHGRPGAQRGLRQAWDWDRDRVPPPPVAVTQALTRGWARHGAPGRRARHAPRCQGQWGAAVSRRPGALQLQKQPRLDITSCALEICLTDRYLSARTEPVFCSTPSGGGGEP